MKYLLRHKYVYLFITVFSIIGFITGFFYYQTQPNDIKNDIKESINIEEDLQKGTNNISKRLKEIFIIFLSSILIITIINNYLKIFIEPFQIGFVFSFLTTYGLKFSLIYTIIYYIIPLLFILILIRISTTISLNIIKLIYKKDYKSKRQLIIILKKYLLISLFLIIYEFFLSIFSTNINGYLMTII